MLRNPLQHSGSGNYDTSDVEPGCRPAGHDEGLEMSAREWLAVGNQRRTHRAPADTTRIHDAAALWPPGGQWIPVGRSCHQSHLQSRIFDELRGASGPRHLVLRGELESQGVAEQEQQ